MILDFITYFVEKKRLCSLRDPVTFYVTKSPKLIFQLKRLGNIQIWIDAAAQILYSFSLSFGGVITLSVGNDIHNNCERDAVVLGISNCLTAIYAGVAVFSVLGFKVRSVDYMH